MSKFREAPKAEEPEGDHCNTETPSSLLEEVISADGLLLVQLLLQIFGFLLPGQSQQWLLVYFLDIIYA